LISKPLAGYGYLFFGFWARGITKKDTHTLDLDVTLSLGSLNLTMFRKQVIIILYCTKKGIQKKPSLLQGDRVMETIN